MTGTLLGPAVLVGGGSVLVAVHLVAMALCGAALGVPVQRVQLFRGPRLSTFHLRQTRIDVGLIPLGGAVEFERNRLAALPAPRRIAVALSGCAALALLGFALGAPPALLLSAPVLLARGALNPLTVGASVLAQLMTRAHDAPLATLGALALALAVFNLLPLPGLNGGYVLERLIRAVAPKLLPRGKLPTPLLVAGLVLMFAVAASWSIALVAALFR